MSFHKKFCNWASQKKININKVTYKRAENAFIDTLACILSGVKEKQSKVAFKYCLENNHSGKILYIKLEEQLLIYREPKLSNLKFCYQLLIHLLHQYYQILFHGCLFLK